MEQKRPQRAKTKRPPDGSGTQYRLYFLQSVERLISYSHEFEADDDDQAIHIAEAWREGRPAELWEGARKVKMWEGDS